MFKYLPPDRIDVLTDNLLCFNNPLNFNDPFEFNVSFDLSNFIPMIRRNIAQSSLEKSLSDSELISFKNLPLPLQNKARQDFKNNIDTILENDSDKFVDYAKKTFRKFNNEFIQYTRVLSLTEKPNNILMWGHYAQSHSGFVIEFDKDSSFFHQRRSDKDEYGFLRKVIYQRELPNNDPYSTEQVVNHFLTKSLDWEYECEWRMLLVSLDAYKKININDKIFDLYPFPSSAIKNIILGCNISKKLRDSIEIIISTRKDYKHVNILQASRSTHNFEIIIEEYK